MPDAHRSPPATASSAWSATSMRCIASCCTRILR
jgi:hypothetical protein